MTKLLRLIPWPVVLLAAGIGYTAAGEIHYRDARENMFSDVVRNQIVAQHLKGLRLECDRIARQQRFYPRNAEEFNRLLRGKIPKSPWGGFQRVVLDADADVVAASERRGVDYKIIGNGKYDPAFKTPRAYGAILYKGDGRSFSLYGVGKVRDWAVVAAQERGAMD